MAPKRQIQASGSEKWTVSLCFWIFEILSCELLNCKARVYLACMVLSLNSACINTGPQKYDILLAQTLKM